MNNGVDVILAIIDGAAPLPLTVASPFVSPAAESLAPSQTGGSRANDGPGKKQGTGRGGTGSGRPQVPGGDPDAFNLRLAFLPLTDLGNSERFRARNAGRLLYCETLPGSNRGDGGWVCWDSRRWSVSNALSAVRMAEHDTVRAIQDEAKACEAEADRLVKEHADIIERAPPRKKKAVPVTRRTGNVIEVEFRPKRGKGAGKGSKRRAAAAAAPAPAGETTADAGSGKISPDKRDPGKIAARVMTFYRQAFLLRRFGRDCEFNARLSQPAKHAAPYLLVAQAELDRDVFAFNCENGTLVFRRQWEATPAVPREERHLMADPAVYGHERWQAVTSHIKFKPHDPDDLITKLAPVVFDPDAACPQFEAFLEKVQPEAAMRDFLRDWKGYQLTGDTSEARMCLFLGRGRNGKGTFEEATAAVIGDYAESTAVETFTLEGKSKAAGSPTPELAKLPGVRSLRSSEPKRGAVLNEQLIKMVTGGDPIEARHLNRPFFTYYSQFKWSVSSNYEPDIKGTDEGIWARVTKVPWPVFLREEERDLQLGSKLRAEAPGILNWMLTGTENWLARGLVLPDTVKQATAEYRRDRDILGRWLEACTVIEAGARTQSSLALECFNAWAKVSGGGEWKNRGFANAMAERGFKKTQSNVMWWLDLKLIRSASDFVDEHGRPRTRVGAEPPAAAGDPGAGDLDDFEFK